MSVPLRLISSSLPESPLLSKPNPTVLATQEMPTKKRASSHELGPSSKRERSAQRAQRKPSKPQEAGSRKPVGRRLNDLGDVDKLVYMMQHEWSNNGIRDLSSLVQGRKMLVSALDSTEEIQLLERFLELGGLALLDQWIQEVTAWSEKLAAEQEEGGGGQEERICQDLLMALVAALQRLPVDLVALKSCAVGRSVNHLKANSQPEIQRMARKLVEVWKKRVDAELKEAEATSMEAHSSNFSSEEHLNAAKHQRVLFHTSRSSLGFESSPSSAVTGMYASVASPCPLPQPVLPYDGKSVKASSPLSTGNSSLPKFQATKNSEKGAFWISNPSRIGRHTDDRSEGSEQKGCCIISHMEANDDYFAYTKAGCDTRTILNSLGAAPDCSAMKASPSVLEMHDLNLDSNTVVGPSRMKNGAALLVNKGRKSERRRNLRSSPIEGNNLMKGENEQQSKNSGISSLTYTAGLQEGITLLASIAASEWSATDGKAFEPPTVYQKPLRKGGPISKQLRDLSLDANLMQLDHNSRHPVQVAGALSGEHGGHLDRNSSTLSFSQRLDGNVDALSMESNKGVLAFADAGASTSTDSACSQCLVPGSAHFSSVSRTHQDRARDALEHDSTGAPLHINQKAHKKAEAAVEDVERETSMSYHDSSLIEFSSKAKECLSHLSPDEALEGARQIALDAEQEILSYQCHSSNGSWDRSSTGCHNFGDMEKPNRSPEVSETMQRGLDQCPPADSPSVASDANLNLINMQPEGHRGSCDAVQNEISDPAGVSNKVQGDESNVYSTLERPSPASQILNLQQAAQITTPSPTRNAEDLPYSAGSRSDGTTRVVLDLNRRLDAQEEDPTCPAAVLSSEITSTPVAAGPRAPIAIVAAIKRPFIPPAAPFRKAGELGWKGSAATSAFRPTRPCIRQEKASETVQSNVPEALIAVKPCLDFDLNVAADQGALDYHTFVTSHDSREPSSSSSILGRSGRTHEPVARPWDLNNANEDAEGGNRDSKAGESVHWDVKSRRGTMLDFDLNEGPTSFDSENYRLPGSRKPPIPCSFVPTAYMQHTGDGLGNANGRMPLKPANSSYSTEDSLVTPGDVCFQYSFCRQGPSGLPGGMAYSSIPPTAYSYAAFPVGFSPPPPFYQSFAAPLMSACQASVPAAFGSMDGTMKPLESAKPMGLRANESARMNRQAQAMYSAQDTDLLAESFKWRPKA